MNNYNTLMNFVYGMDKAALARAMHAEDPTEGPNIPQRETLNATSSLARLMQITRTRGLHNQDFGLHGMSSVKSAQARAMHAEDPTERGTIALRPTLNATSSLARLMQITKTRGLQNSDFGQHGMNSAH